MPIDKYAVVQHSAYGYKADSDFMQGLESRHITKRAEVTLVKKAGGITFDTYLEAEDFIERESYPPDAVGLIPRAPGEFSDECIDGLRIYVVGPDRAAIADLKAMRDELAGGR